MILQFIVKISEEIRVSFIDPRIEEIVEYGLWVYLIILGTPFEISK